MKFWVYFWGFFKFLESYGIDSLIKRAIGFAVSINWTYLEFKALKLFEQTAAKILNLFFRHILITLAVPKLIFVNYR